MEYENRDKFAALATEMSEKPEDFGGDSEMLRQVVDNLNGLAYDDFASELFAAPKMVMVEHFTELGRLDIVEQIKNGDFDQ